MFHLTRGNKKELVVNFTSKGTDAKAIQTLEFTGTYHQLQYNTLHVSDTTKRWYQNAHTVSTISEKINETVEMFKDCRVTFIGFSMGGFGALLFSSMCKCDSVIAISPQTDLIKAQRMHMYNDTLGKIQNFVHPTVVPLIRKDIPYQILGGNSKDMKQINMLPKYKNVKVSNVFNTHNVSKKWKEQGTLIKNIRKLIEGN